MAVPSQPALLRMVRARAYFARSDLARAGSSWDSLCSSALSRLSAIFTTRAIG